ncbi:Rne/Rng family ribonuclease [Sphingobium sufflavum]|uniref:Rne/Rng family ribonuclease n=1 Tax=Sphingobium sufflavum TaxID=1129547 RepID=UPI001F1F47DE|nr:Rne/Rng family ribonuclease [Sphingobium sufflavum]MCE7797693.1 Rne/Rng family ribonuclease [Sphingobium sufflavum]
MTLRMLIDARHREETRVAVVKGNRIEEFDFESAEHKQLKGNIYLAKVTRVEPSLQAAFVDYGGNRHGFLAFSEIHPDYYQIPREDREALLAEEAEHAAEEAALREAEDEDYDGPDHDHDGHEHGFDDQAHHDEDDDHHGHHGDASAEEGAEDGTDTGERAEGESEGEGSGEEGGRGRPRRRGGSKIDAAAEELRRKRMALRRRYKIQDVIRRRQVLLVQVVKEERGNKGAALTSYLSLAGRYCVLMPNTSHGGGISRKISNNADRKRLKSIIAELALPSSMGCIVRTAGLSRTKPEIRRDFDYLARLWDEIRENTLGATAPALIHNDSDLIKRAIRDIYNRDIEEVIVEGEHGYKAAKDFMRLLMPSHARKVRTYADPVSLFQRFGVEDQLAAMYHPVVQLKSGGYLVINPTEALVSIDINSGRSTREHNIEQTATATNLEAAREIARQLRLRDMAGLVVIDFIDMEHNSNVRKVEKAMKESLKDDRARIQIGRISSFGLMEMSRQRLRTGVLEASTRACPHCEGTGLVRTASSAGLSALRLLEEEAARGRGSIITLRASQEAAFYVLNNKRREIDEIEARYGVLVQILPDGEDEGARMSVEATGPRPEKVVTYAPVVEEPEEDEIYDEEEVEEEEAEVEVEDEGERAPRERSNGEDRGDDGNRKRKRRRRGRRGRRDGEPGEGNGDGSVDGSGEGSGDDEAGNGDAGDDAGDKEGGAAPTASEGDAAAVGDDGQPRKSRRGRRGGRRRRGGENGSSETGAADSDGESVAADAVAGEGDAGDIVPVADAVVEAPVADVAVEPERKTRRRPRARKGAEEAVAVDAPVAVVEAPAAEAPVAEDAAEEVKPKRRGRRTKAQIEAEAAEAAALAAAPAAAPAVEAEPDAPAPKPRRTRAKKVKADEGAEAGAPAAEAATPAPAEAPAAAEASSDQGEAGEVNESGEPVRRGWWQRTFGN